MNTNKAYSYFVRLLVIPKVPRCGERKLADEPEGARGNNLLSPNQIK